MSHYTDKDFGFSFWYPSNWSTEIHTPTKAPDTYYPGGVLMKSLYLMDSKGNLMAAVNSVSSQGSSITDEAGGGPNRACPAASCDTVRYFFDSASHTWMQEYPTEANQQHQTGIATAADVSNNTMGGLHIFPGSARFGSDSVVPLSAKNFVIVIAGDAGNFDQKVLVNTIVATDPTVATPVSTAQQTVTIQAEQKAYAGQ
jgi:hypothetical protein